MAHQALNRVQVEGPISAVTFDVGGTLIQPWPSVGHVYAEVAARHGFDAPPADALNQRFREAWRACKQFDYTRSGWAALVEQTFGLETPAPFFDELYERFAEADAWNVFDDVKPALEWLAAAEVRLAVISNWDDRLRLLLDRLNLAGYFETQVISCEVGFAKPSPVIFEQAALKLGLSPRRILHIGDSADMDLEGAQRAGFQAILLDRSARRGGASALASLEHLPQIFPPAQLPE